METCVYFYAPKNEGATNRIIYFNVGLPSRWWVSEYTKWNLEVVHPMMPQRSLLFLM